MCREHAGALEARGEVDAALAMFARAAEFPGQTAAELRRSRAGVARCAIKAGDARRGARVALELNDAPTTRECAALLESSGHFSDAARLFEQAGAFEDAASVYVSQKQFDLAKPLMDRVANAGPTASSLRLRYAAAKESQGALAEAAESYELARDFDAAVRLRLSDDMRDAERAFAICRSSASQEACAMAAAYCRAAGDATRALEFLVLARRGADAFELARETGNVETLVSLLGDDGVPEEYRRVASYFETAGSFSKAADAHRRAGRLDHAVRCYLKAGDDDSVGAAVAVAGDSRDDALVARVVDFLSGDISDAGNGGVSHSAWLFKLHVALGDYDAAAKTSGVIAQQEQEMGNYKLAHAQLLASHVELMKERKSVPGGLNRQLALLHSYVLVKSLVSRNDHEGAARLLRRVAANISKFPAHVVPILTSAVVECARAGLKKTSLELAQRLMKPELRAKIGDAYKRKIETIARKPDPNAADKPEPGSPCPFCDAPGGAYEMTCEVCRADVPLCVASGRRVTREEWTRCPACRFPCNANAFKTAALAENGECPMCRARVDVDALERPGSGAPERPGRG
jgi:WD repeat-containing protein 19